MPSDTIPIYTMTEAVRNQRIPDDELDHLEWVAGSKAAIVTMSKETLRELLRAYRAQEIRVIGSLEGITTAR